MESGLCACGCGREVERPRTGRPPKYATEACRARAARRRAGITERKAAQPPAWEASDPPGFVVDGIEETRRRWPYSDSAGAAVVRLMERRPEFEAQTAGSVIRWLGRTSVNLRADAWRSGQTAVEANEVSWDGMIERARAAGRNVSRQEAALETAPAPWLADPADRLAEPPGPEPIDAEAVADAARSGRYRGYGRVGGRVYEFVPGQPPRPATAARMGWESPGVS